ncbi:hypothetical protein NBRC116592_37010 [Colwellia sp. KU-HH00111]|uniref:Ppx/GppA phosphatase family protein n=1 Tax=Colwellia sp. KU-HH00111 TaxID=3127652 RepID=UPI00310C80E7
MKQSINIPQYDNNHHAVVDLGSNSFHLLIVRLQDNNVVVVNKVKEKVRLAAGLNEQCELSMAAINNGLNCLHLFAQHLASIPVSQIRIVATATLRIAKNRDEFLTQANKILPLNINLLSGEQEAHTIYRGVAHTCKNKLVQKRLVIDIGGASTELIIGEGFNALKAVSLNLGCVSFKERFFTDGELTPENFNAAISAATAIVKPICTDFIHLNWQSVVGSSGTMRAIAEILAFHQRPEIITADFLQQLQAELIKCKSIDNICLAGLRVDRAPVLASGLSILIALFNCLSIKELKLSEGALREGLLYEMLPH